jgi:hypothetical protein
MSVPSPAVQLLVRRGPWIVSALAAALALRLLLFVDAHAVNLMVMDQFDFYVPLFDEGYGAIAKLRFQFQDSPHRMGAGWAVIEVVARASSWDTRADSFSIAGAMIAGCGLALWLSWRLHGALSAWDACIPLLALTLKQFATFVGTPDIALAALPFLLLVATGLALTVVDVRLRLALLLGLDLLCVYTGFALFAGVLVPLLIAYEGYAGRVEWRTALGGVALASVIGLSFFVGYDSSSARNPVATQLGVVEYLSYATNLFATFFEARSAVAAGAVGLLWPLLLGAPLAVSGLRMVRRQARPADSVVVLLSGFGSLFVAFNTLGRVGESPDYAFASRYVTLMIPGVLGAYFSARAIRASRPRGFALSLLLSALLAGELASDAEIRGVASSMAEQKSAWRDCYLGSRDFNGCNQSVGHVPYPPREDLARIERRFQQLEERRLNLFKDAAS